MRDLQQLKDDYAVTKNFLDWDELIEYSYKQGDDPSDAWDDIIILAQKEALKNAHEVFLNNDAGDTLEQELILAESNILK